jgi:CDP-paratose 2-epimerase
MSVVVVTGSGGLIGAEAVRLFAAKSHTVVGIDNDMRAHYFGDSASTRWSVDRLRAEVAGYRHHAIDVRDAAAVERVFTEYGCQISAIVHAAAQPSHDWAGRQPSVDFGVNAVGTLNLLEATRAHCPEAVFMFLSTNKVYGDAPNSLPLIEIGQRYECAPEHPFAAFGIDESMPIDQTRHSLFGASKAAADLLVQEYGRYFGIKSACFRCGCLTGAGHSGAELHGFLSYLMICTITGKPYTVLGYKGRQVRDNIHSADLVDALYAFYQAPRVAAVYNLGGGRYSNCSVIEAIAACEGRAGKRLRRSYTERNRVGDHIWWISDLRRFQADYPDWRIRYSIDDIFDDLYEGACARLRGSAA